MHSMPSVMAGEGEHAPELAAAEDADAPSRELHSAGSGCSSDRRGLKLAEAHQSFPNPVVVQRDHGCREQRRVHGAGRPIASVPTGTPAGICTIDSSESIPFSAFDSTGTPSTGRWVFAAAMPGRCAAPPAPATITSEPRVGGRRGVLEQQVGRAVGAHDAGLVRARPSSSRVSTACRIVSQSLRDPMITPTIGSGIVRAV